MWKPHVTFSHHINGLHWGGATWTHTEAGASLGGWPGRAGHRGYGTMASSSQLSVVEDTLVTHEIKTQGSTFTN